MTKAERDIKRAVVVFLKLPARETKTTWWLDIDTYRGMDSPTFTNIVVARPRPGASRRDRKLAIYDNMCYASAEGWRNIFEVALTAHLVGKDVVRAWANPDYPLQPIYDELAYALGVLHEQEVREADEVDARYGLEAEMGTFRVRA